MKVLVTAGNTQTPIDRVRCITNIFTGRTGASLAREAHARGHDVVLATSHPETVEDLKGGACCRVDVYRTFADLETLLAAHLAGGGFDAIIHAAAVNDYHVAGVYSPAAQTVFDSQTLRWHGSASGPALTEQQGGKIRSSEPELWLRLTRAPKLIDRFRSPWGFHGQLVKFKLEVAVSDAELLRRAEQARLQSQADWMVANTLEDAAHWAYVGPFPDGYHKVERPTLAAAVLDALENSSR